MKILKKARNWFQGLPDKKRYIELLTAFLSVPLMLTVLILNISNLQSKKDNDQVTSSGPTPQVIVIEKDSQQNPASPNITTHPAATAKDSDNKECKKEIGPIEIVYPSEDEVISKNPVCIDIVRNGDNYCSIAWSYRINNDTWSEYTDKSICLYSLPPGEKNLEVKIKSIASSDEKLLKRTFIVGGDTPTPEATSSGDLN